MKLTYDCEPNLLRFFIRDANYNQDEVATILNVTPAAISKAIKNDPNMSNLRKRIVDLVRTKKGKAA